MKKYILSGLFIAIILSVVFYLKGCYEFDKIENEMVIDWISKNEITITYTTKNDIKNLYNNNKDFFQDLVFELDNIDDIYKYDQIQIPFNYPENDLFYYGNSKDKVYLTVDSSLKEKLIFLSNELKINRITTRLTNGYREENSNNRLNCDFIFTQDDGRDDSYIGIAASTAEYGDNTGYIFKQVFKSYSGNCAFMSIIDETDDIFWYYRCSREMDKRKYGFWQRLYDVIHCNL